MKKKATQSTIIQVYSISTIQGIIQPNRAYVVDGQVSISTIFYDSRKIVPYKKGLFFAYKGRQDGHHYLQEAYDKGVRNFVLQDDRGQELTMPDANIFWVADSLASLQQLAQHRRQAFQGLVIGITGSNGKTIVKEWLFQLLAPEYQIVRSPKSYNSQLGVALSLWELSDQYNLAIIEAGISEVGEMQRLEKMIRPDIGVLTTIGLAHQQGFSAEAQKAEEKLRLFNRSDTLIYPALYLKDIEIPKHPIPFTWGEGANNQLQVRSTQQLGDGQTLVNMAYTGKEFEVRLPFIDQASVENATSCVAVMLHLGYDAAIISERIPHLTAIAMRLVLKKGKNNCSIIDDSYSNDLYSLQIALDFLNQQQQHPHKVLVLSDIPGVHLSEPENLDQLRQLVLEQNLDRLILIGPMWSEYAAEIHPNSICFASTEACMAYLKQHSIADSTILLKGARDFHFEDISQLLVAKSHDTLLEINLNALAHNLNMYRSILPQEVKLMAMVKAFSYGSGSFEIANVLQFHQVDYLTVAFADEGVELRNGGITLPIVVMSPDENTFETLLSNHLEPEIYNFRILSAFLSFLKTKGLAQVAIHIKVDTGMHRLGFMPEELDELLSLLREQQLVRVQSVFSHLASAENPEDRTFTTQQIHIFDEFTDRLQLGLGYSFIRHLAATSGIALGDLAYFDMVRLGIGLYGFGKSDLNLEEVGVLKTNVTQIKHIPAGETVGYNRRAVLGRDSKIATVKIGYADGYDRRFGNGVGQMQINGQIVKTIGDICMDMCMLDVTDVEVAEEDEVLVFPDLRAAAKSIGTIPYELLVNISERVKRVYFI